MVSICPVISENTKDHGFVILIKNKQTIVVIELKLNVAALTGQDKDWVAQLFTEGYLICKEEGIENRDLICVYYVYMQIMKFLT